MVTISGLTFWTNLPWLVKHPGWMGLRGTPLQDSLRLNPRQSVVTGPNQLPTP